LNEPELILRLQQREEPAFRQLVEGWKDRIYNTVLGLLQNEQDAEDITQEVFVSAWKNIKEFKSEAGINTWLFKIAVNNSIDLIRKKNRKKRFAFVSTILSSDGIAETTSAEFNHPGVMLEKKEDALLLFSAIRKLPEKQKVAYNLQKMEGLAHSEIAMIMNLSVAAVESLLQRAKTNLRKALSSHFEINKRP
jgi:RNA polymerase sigma factor (sigma-70 family)